MKFKGKYNHTIDAKNRIIVPAKLRSGLGEDSFTITLGAEGCLYIYPEAEWEELSESLRKLPGTNKVRIMKRKLMMNAADGELDKQGRIVIPAELCEKAGLLKDVVFIGNINKIELWSKDRLEAVINDDGDMEDLADELAEFGISL